MYFFYLQNQYIFFDLQNQYIFFYNLLYDNFFIKYSFFHK
jgi:hypothetical protein